MAILTVQGMKGSAQPMSRLSYETALTLVYDPVSGNRAATRSALYSLGFRQIDLAATLDVLAESIANRPPDLVLCEAQGFEDELCRLVQLLRQGAAGYNPFLVIIVTAWEKSSALATRVVNSGADDLLLRPFSPAQLGQRIRAHVEKRKAFVITSEYVGPDRRKDGSRGSAVAAFYPPNSLKMKASDGLSPEEADRRLDSELKIARRILTAEKLRRDAFQICVLWRLMQQQTPGLSRYEIDLSKLSAVADGIAKRCAVSEFHQAAPWCDALTGAIDALRLGIDRTSALDMLGEAALNLNQAIDPETARADRLRQIDATVALIRARTEPALAS